jgi:hypothetical protein
MGYIKEPLGINFIVDSTPLTQASRKKISEVIAYYKATGRKMAVKRTPTKSLVVKNKSSLTSYKVIKKV